MNSKQKTKIKRFEKILLSKRGLILIGSFCFVIFILFIAPNIFMVSFDATHMKADVNSSGSSEGSSVSSLVTQSDDANASGSLSVISSSSSSASIGGVMFDPGNPLMQNSSDVTHVQTPNSLKAIYISSWVAGSPDLKNKIKKLIEDTELNAVIIDFKDSTGKISGYTGVPEIDNVGCTETRIKDIKGLVKEFHDSNIYLIARIAVFQDPCMTGKHPDYAVKRKSDGKIWKDRKGLSWMYAGSKEVWEYNIKVARVAYYLGFDEVNFDYIRFPSDGNMKDLSYPVAVSNSTSTDVSVNTRSNILSRFFIYVDDELRKKAGDNKPKISADVFGLVATNYDDLGIGQVLEKILPYVDYIAPMVYPSHFANGWNGYAKPATHPYEVISISMGKAVARAKAMGEDPNKLRPWLQDFNLGATYTPQMIKDQIRGAKDVGLNSWMMWDPANKYNSTKKILIGE